ncbi:hypothetical protein LEP1GSC041_0176 [Leptospira noguchii str. 2006001870]|nr:hypothetical protein LEP1GSC041_0176 [Leptospira noguchii str. 2006001870]
MFNFSFSFQFPASKFITNNKSSKIDIELIFIMYLYSNILENNRIEASERVRQIIKIYLHK